jgi:hypothetical protein
MEVAMLLNRLMLAAVCVMPAIPVRAPVAGAPLVASFMYACESEEPRPTLTTRYSEPGRPKPRDAQAPVEVFMSGQVPTRAFRVIGQVRVRANSGRTSTAELVQWTKRGARQLGGDLVVEMVIDDAAALHAGPVGLLCATARVAQWR